ncbi:MAG: Coenzyme F420 hydrogenase/dehydrogenase, beta subunit C-terminal domain [Candidatus Hodarchaeota archaeon]
MSNINPSPIDKTREFLQERLVGSKDVFGKLMKEIVNTGICTHCSACVSICDVLEWDEEEKKPKLTGKCTACALCYNQCPRTITRIEQLVGNYRNAFVAKSSIPEVKGQDGGTTTAFLLYLIDKGLVDGAIVTKRDENWKGIPMLAKTREEILAASGSLYTHAQTVNTLFDALKQGHNAIAFVGTPCNIDAIDKMERSEYGMMLYNLRTQILKVGLFCMDSFSPETLYGFFEREGIDLKTIKKMDISKGKFNLYNEAGEAVKSYKIKQLNKYKSSSCDFCTDLTSENADVSFGSVGSPEGYNTVLTRTARGDFLLKDAAAKGYIELKEMGDEELNPVFNLARMKKVAQYNINVRKEYVFTTPEGPDKVKPAIVTKEITPMQSTPFLMKKLKLKNTKLSKDKNTLSFTLVNSSGYTMEQLDIRISVNEDIFEKAAWRTNLSALYPYETMAFEYPVNVGDSETSALGIIVEVKNPTDVLLNESISIQKLIDKAKELAAKKAAKKPAGS